MDYNIKSRIWIEIDGETLLGEGRVRLLNEIAKTGSISSAAKSLKMSYKKAWNLINAVNDRAKYPVISSSIGGKGGGGAELTEYGLKLVKTFEEINKNCWCFLDEEINKSDL